MLANICEAFESPASLNYRHYHQPPVCLLFFIFSIWTNNSIKVYCNQSHHSFHHLQYLHHSIESVTCPVPSGGGIRSDFSGWPWRNSHRHAGDFPLVFVSALLGFILFSDGVSLFSPFYHVIINNKEYAIWIQINSFPSYRTFSFLIVSPSSIDDFTLC